MTIPTLIANTHKRQYTATFKKAKSTLSNAARMSEAQFGYDFAGINQLCNTNSGTDHPETKQAACAILNGTLKGAHFYYGMNKLEGYTIDSQFFNGMWSFQSFPDSLPIYTLSDEQLLILSSRIGDYGCENRSTVFINTAGKQTGTVCYGLIDINGVSKPNKEVKCTKGSNRYHVQIQEIVL